MKIIFGFLFLGFFLSSCKDSKTDDVTHQEISEADSLEAIQKGFVESSKGVPESEIPAGIDRFFNLLARVTRSETRIEADDFITVDGMISALNSSEAMADLSSKQKRAVAKGFRSAVSQLGDSIQQMGVDDHKIVLVEKIDEDQRLVYVKLYDNELNVVTQMRWWLLRTDKGWRAYDYEDLSVGLRVVSLMGSVISIQVSGQNDGWITDFMPVAQQLQVFDPSDLESFDRLEQPLLKLRGNDLPLSIRKFASMTYTSVLTARADFEEALAELVAAEKGGYTSPISNYQKGTVFAGLERHEEALASYQKYTERFGSDSDVMELVADSYLQIGEREKAREAALKGLADNAISVGCLASLAAASSPKEFATGEMEERFLKMPYPEEAFETALDYQLTQENFAGARSLFTILKKAFPESDLIEYYEEEFPEE